MILSSSTSGMNSPGRGIKALRKSRVLVGAAACPCRHCRLASVSPSAVIETFAALLRTFY